MYSIIHSANNYCVLPKSQLWSSWNSGASEGQTLQAGCDSVDPITKGMLCTESESYVLVFVKGDSILKVHDLKFGD